MKHYNFDDEQGHIDFLLDTVDLRMSEYKLEKSSISEKNYEIGGKIQMREDEWEEEEYKEKLKQYTPRGRALMHHQFLWGKICMCKSIKSYLDYCQQKIAFRRARKQIKEG